jgi:hypothetical protein
LTDEQFRELLEDHKASSFLCCEEENLNDDARIRDFTGEMIIREEEIVLTESYDGREPYTITLKRVDCDHQEPDC